jgi:ribose transport system ATP-binding protein
LLTFMTGREIGEMYPKKTNTPGEVKMSVKGLSNEFVKNITFDLHKGEILGVYGLKGSGHLELGMTLFGCFKRTSGVVLVDGKPLSLRSPRECIAKGISFLPSDRKTEGLVLIQSVQENIMTPYYETGKQKNIIRESLEKKIASEWISSLAIKTPSKDTKAESLSGGNQQKVVLAKWLATNPQIIIMNEPTRGIDVVAKAEIYKILNNLTEKGISIIMITSELPELMAMSDHVIVMHEGVQTGTFYDEEITQDKIISAAIGGAIYECKA